MSNNTEPYVHPSGDLFYFPNFISESEEAQFLTHVYGRSYSGSSATEDDGAATAGIANWVQLRFRRLVNFGGIPDAKGMTPQPIPSWVTEPIAHRIQGLQVPSHPTATTVSSGQTTKKDEEEQKLAEPSKESEEQRVQLFFPQNKPINHVLLNEYHRPYGIFPHEDGPVYFPVVAIVSLESAVPLVFTKKSKSRVSSTAAPSSADSPLTSMAASQSFTTDEGKEEDQESSATVVIYAEPRSLILFQGQFYHDYLHTIPEATVDRIDRATCLNWDYCKSLLQRGQEEEETSVRDIERKERRLSVTYRNVLRVFRISAHLLGHK